MGTHDNLLIDGDIYRDRVMAIMGFVV